ncbi:MAG TPA: putative metal-dependent hydrolase [Thermoanaerobaculia bacterium]
MSDPRYPVGPLVPRTSLNHDERNAMLDEIAATPQRLRDAVAGLDDAQLDTPYRDGGWSLRQVVHHVPDSHLNAYTRLKLALTEDNPIIRPYDEALWAKLPDAQDTPIETSLTLLESLHARWVGLFRSLQPEDFARTFRHPEHSGVQTIDWLVAMYSWHGRHHVAHITSARERLGW